MKVIVLTGLVSVEKIELVRDLAQYFSGERSVVVLDNIARMPVESFNDAIPVKRIEGDNINSVLDTLRSIRADVSIVAISEQAHPEKLFIALDELSEQYSDRDIYTLALIDTRTCDCFPNVREALEMYADVSVMIPYELDEVLHYVDSA